MTTIQDLDRAVMAARGVKPAARREWFLAGTDCYICGEPLVGIQSKTELCWECQFRQEYRDARDYEEVV